MAGGIITTAYGGYNTKKSAKLLRIIGVCAVASALPIPFLDHFAAVGTLFWLLLFFGGFILPSMTGIMISSVGEFQKAQANSVAYVMYNACGYLPAPLLYGSIATVCADNSRIPMAVLLFSTLGTVALSFYGLGRRIKLLEEQDGTGDIKNETSNLATKDQFNEEGSDNSDLENDQDYTKLLDPNIIPNGPETPKLGCPDLLGIENGEKVQLEKVVETLLNVE